MGSSSESARGLAHFAARAARDIESSRARLLPVRTKEIRTALRRVRAMCEILSELVVEPSVAELKREARDLMRALGPLRDVHVERAFLREVFPGRLPGALETSLATEQRARGSDARKAVRAFDTVGFLTHAARVAQAALPFEREHPVMLHVAHERLFACRALLTEARANLDAEEPLHELRIGLKRFRYVVESFLPGVHAKIAKRLKSVQDVLGTIHDLDVVSARLRTRSLALDGRTRKNALARVKRRRQTALADLAARMRTGLLRPFVIALPRSDALVDVAVACAALHRGAPVSSAERADRVEHTCAVVMNALADAGVLDTARRDRDMLTVAARHVGAEPRALRASRAIAAKGAIQGLDDAFLDDAARLARRADAPKKAARAAARGDVSAHPTLTTVLALARSLELSRGGPDVVDARVVFDTLLLTLSGGRANRVPTRVRRALKTTTGIDLVVVWRVPVLDDLRDGAADARSLPEDLEPRVPDSPIRGPSVSELRP